MKLIPILFFALITQLVSAQKSIDGYIIDKHTKEPLSYVNIGIMNTPYGTVSDDLGRFSFKANDVSDSLMISYIGYTSVSKAISDMKTTDTIALESASYVMSEISIVASNFDEEVTLGARNKKGRGHSVGFGNAQLGCEIGALIEVEKETFVKSVNFVLNHAKGDSLLFRVNMYEYKDKKIGERILVKNIFVKKEQQKGLNTINVEAFDIVLRDDILLTLEWLRDFDKEGNRMITFDTKKSRKYGGVYGRFSKSSKFKKLTHKKKNKPCIYIVGSQKS